jgi:hypothetical protein
MNQIKLKFQYLGAYMQIPDRLSIINSEMLKATQTGLAEILKNK